MLCLLDTLRGAARGASGFAVRPVYGAIQAVQVRDRKRRSMREQTRVRVSQPTIACASGNLPSAAHVHFREKCSCRALTFYPCPQHLGLQAALVRLQGPVLALAGAFRGHPQVVCLILKLAGDVVEANISLLEVRMASICTR